VLEAHCSEIGRDAAQIIRSANMPMQITDDAGAKKKLAVGLMRRFGRSESEAHDTVLAGSVAEIQDKIGRLQEAGVDQLFIPTFLPPWSLDQLDQFITDVAPAFR
jgi:alkanesulfonate monooxygenase SsuD/methylene tetrahydromethanopterin reductase-like flavin-dependent oxidoreductase (luciferase family)